MVPWLNVYQVTDPSLLPPQEEPQLTPPVVLVEVELEVEVEVDVVAAMVAEGDVELAVAVAVEVLVAPWHLPSLQLPEQC